MTGAKKAPERARLADELAPELASNISDGKGCGGTDRDCNARPGQGNRAAGTLWHFGQENGRGGLPKRWWHGGNSVAPELGGWRRAPWAVGVEGTGLVM